MGIYGHPDSHIIENGFIAWCVFHCNGQSIAFLAKIQPSHLDWSEVTERLISCFSARILQKKSSDALLIKHLKEFEVSGMYGLVERENISDNNTDILFTDYFSLSACGYAKVSYYSMTM